MQPGLPDPNGADININLAIGFVSDDPLPYSDSYLTDFNLIRTLGRLP